MSLITETLIYITGVIFTTLVIALGLSASVATTMLLFNRLKTLYLAGSPAPSELTSGKTTNSGREFWEFVVVFLTFISPLGYVIGILVFLTTMDVAEAALRSTITMIGVNIGIAIPAAVIIYIDRAIRRTASR